MVRVRIAGNVLECSTGQLWGVVFICVFMSSFVYFMAQVRPNYDQMADLSEKDLEKLGKIPPEKPVIEVDSYKFDPSKKKVSVEVKPLEPIKGQQKSDNLGDKNENVAPNDVTKVKPWPKGEANSWRLHDHVARAAKNERVPMAMDAVKSSMNYIQEVQKEIIRNQNRAPDSRYNINVTHSDLLSLDRPIADTRPEICKHFVYDYDDLPKATVIVPFYNEALTMLLRTVHSILNRTPDKLLEEIILVDDRSTDAWLGETLEHYLGLLPKVQLVRNEKRVGLIVSRMRGARLANAPVIIFQDAHTEANEGWLPPLLDEIKRHPNAVYQPYVDVIDTMTLQYSNSGRFHKGAFSWDLRYVWLKVQDHVADAALEAGHPFFSPTLVGCAIAVQKDYFFHIGAFDEGLKIWGGENTELGFRTWQCGGKVTTVTCARVGHAFKEFPYSFDGDKETTVQKNLIRVAETWMDGFRKYFYASTRVYEFKRAELDAEELASLQERKQLRTNLKCHNFEWYMHNIAPEIDIPPSDAIFYGEILNMQTKACWEILDDYYVGMTYVCYHHKIIPKNNFALTSDGLLRYRDKCVKIDPPNPQIRLSECPKPENQEDFGIWEVVQEGHAHGSLQVRRKTPQGRFEFFCLNQVTNIMENHKNEQMPELSLCDKTNNFQRWSFTYHFDWSRVPKDIMAT